MSMPFNWRLAVWAVVLAVGWIRALPAQETVKLACSDRTLASIATSLFEEELDVLVLIPALKTGNKTVESDKWRQLADYRIFFYQVSENWLNREVEQKKIPGLKCVAIRIHGALGIAEDFLEAAQTMKNTICRQWPEYNVYLTERLNNLQELANQAAKENQAAVRNSPCFGKPCIAVRSQAKFLQWLGIRVVETFGEDEPVSEKRLVELAQAAERESVWLIVGNQETVSKELAQKLAERLGVQFVLLQLEPDIEVGGMEAVWRKYLDGNVQKLLAADQGK